ncbi:MAG: DNA gyrase inhibitor YacG [Acidimicrobiia bacterium]|nr:DNA gyrase inhibitor YacG [Acidimicrobiia bacterium]
MSALTCVYCRQQPIDSQWHPFCSERCRMADLGRWLQGDYRVPGPSVAPDQEPSDEDAPPGSFDS